jgi:prolyl-tRNA synthetase
MFGKTLRDVPAEAETVSHQLMLRAGMIQQVAAGVYSYLPLAWRVLRKIETIIREEMDSAGGQELSMPVLQPIDMWEESGRDQAFGKGLFTLVDRRDRTLVLGPTHEELITDLARRNVQSYRDLPIMLYQIQTKFRDEPRPRGGLVRVREFTMKDLYSFDADEAALDVSYLKMLQAYKNIYSRCGLDTIVVEADSGAIGGKESHEFMLIAETGEDEIIYCGQCDFAANAEKATFKKANREEEPPLPLKEVATPGVKTIEEVADFIGVTRDRTLKAVFYSTDGELVLATIRGDMEVNEVKLRNIIKCAELRMASDDELREAGLIAGSASAVGLKDIKVVADDSIELGRNFVVGANKEDTHLKNANYPRDFQVAIMADIAQAEAGHTCDICGNVLFSTTGIEVGHIFKLGTAFSQRQGALYLDSDGSQKPMVMGCYGIGIGRLLAAAIEQNHDEKGIIWPVPIAPYSVYLCALGMEDSDIVSAAENLYSELQDNGVEVLFDDRIESAGVKFNDADLLGIPVRIVVSQRTLKSEKAEIKPRKMKEAELIVLTEVTQKITNLLH